MPIKRQQTGNNSTLSQTLCYTSIYQGPCLNLPQSPAVIGIVTVTEHCHRISVLAFLLHLWSSGKASFYDHILFHQPFIIGTCSLETGAPGQQQGGCALGTLLHRRHCTSTRHYGGKAISHSVSTQTPIPKCPYFLYQGCFCQAK